MYRKLSHLCGITAWCLMAVAACVFISCGGKKQERSLEYLPVQMEKDGNWSIVDTDGKVVVDNEYAPEDGISDIYDDGQYWVKSGDKYRLFNISSPKKPITDDEYDGVTDFSEGRAFVSHVGEPIQMIDCKGKVLTTLSKEVKAVKSSFNDGMAIYTDTNDKFGYIGLNGEIAIKAKYDLSYGFNEGYAITYMNDKVAIIDKKGNKTGDVPARHLYALFQEGKAAKMNFSDRLVFVNHKGETVLKPKKEYTSVYGGAMGFVDGYCVVQTKDNELAVIDDKGETVIRTGKYKNLLNCGNGIFVAKSNDKYGLIDKDDNKLIDFKYDEYGCRTSTDKYIFKDGSSYILVDKDGNEVKGVEFASIAYGITTGVTFTDIKGGVSAIIEPLSTTTGYEPIKGKLSAPDIAAIYRMKPDSTNFSTDIELPESKAGEWKMVVTLEFNERVTKHNMHMETVDDGWFAHEKMVDDGWSWNPDAMLSAVYLHVNVTGAKVSDVSAALDKALVAKGFKAVGDAPIYEAKRANGKYIHISIREDSSKSTITLVCNPNSNYSEEEVDYD